MKVLLLSMPDVVPIIIHEAAVHMPNHGIACVGGNIDPEHEVHLVDLIRKRRSVRKYLSRLMERLQPDLVGLSAMAWQYDTCIRIARLLKMLRPETKIAIGGYHATLMHEEIAAAPEARWIDFMIRGEGEEAFRRLVNSLAGRDDLAAIGSLSYKQGDAFVHNERSANLDLTTLRLPIRDKRRLTWGYHMVNAKIEVLETSRGCTRACTFCSMKHMYGRSFRAYPLERVLADLDDIYYNCRARWVFVSDDNFVLYPERVMELCEAIIARNYRGLHFCVQADCRTMAGNEAMVAKMAEAGFCSVFLGIESGSAKNLQMAGKGDIVDASRRAVRMCHTYQMMVIGGLVFGFPPDDVDSIRETYEFFRDIDADAAYCQILTPYPKTGMRQQLLDEDLIVNTSDYKKYNGLWANVRTRHLSDEELHYQFWYQRQVVLGWWKPSPLMARQGRLWTSIWRFAFKPLLQWRHRRAMAKHGWRGLYLQEVEHWQQMNTFSDLEDYR